jgi:hypothetical protein
VVNFRHASTRYQADSDSSDRSIQYDDERKATARRAFRGLFPRIQLSDVTRRPVRPAAAASHYPNNSCESPAIPAGSAFCGGITLRDVEAGKTISVKHLPVK